MRPCFLPAVLALGLLAAPAAPAAESYQACTGTISALPVVVSSPGTWCLQSDLSTAIATGNAITVSVNNVTIDCNGFKIGGLAAGVATLAQGVRSTRLNTTVRDCRIRGFYFGVRLDGGGAVVEDSRFDGNPYAAVLVDDAVGRRNIFEGNGGTTRDPNSLSIQATGAAVIEDNIVISGFTTHAAGSVFAIFAAGPGPSISRNRVGGLTLPPGGSGGTYGITVGVEATVEGNHLHGSSTPLTVAISCNNTTSLAARNLYTKVAGPVIGCTGLDNLGPSP